MNNEIIGMDDNKKDMGYFEAKFEDIIIHAHKIEVETIKDVNQEIFPLQTPFTGVWHNTNVNGMPQSKDIIGKVYVIFKNQSERSNMSVFLTVQCVVHAPANTESAATFTKLIQYLFEWMNKYVESVKLKDEKGEKFIMPSFGYSQSHFAAAFPE